MKRKKAALYNPYLDTLGGGERHVLTIMKALEDAGYEICIFWDENLNEKISSKLNIPFTYPPQYRKNIFKNGSTLQKLNELKEFDIFIYVTDGSYFFSSAKKNYVYSMVPLKKLYTMNLMNRLKTANFSFITISQFTQDWMQKWGIQSDLIYPCLDNHFVNTTLESLQKEKIILSVGRFFKHLHAKKHDDIIKTFLKLREKNKDLETYKLVLAGSLKDEDKGYFTELQTLVKDETCVELMPNLTFDELTDLYEKAEYYWHFAGFGIDENKHPENVEHLGITPLESMASGCISFCYNAGGPKELIQNGTTGFLFNSIEELEKQMTTILEDTQLQKHIRQNAHTFIQEHFRYETLQKRVWQVMDISESFVPPVENLS